jgi:hypothetical protein
MSQAYQAYKSFSSQFEQVLLKFTPIELKVWLTLVSLMDSIEGAAEASVRLISTRAELAPSSVQRALKHGEGKLWTKTKIHRQNRTKFLNGAPLPINKYYLHHYNKNSRMFKI